MRLLTIDCQQSSSFYKEKLIFRESSFSLFKILADKGNLYILSKSGPQYVLKCFRLEANLDLTQTGTIRSVETISPSFIDDFVKSSAIFQNIMIVNEEKITKIYTGNSNRIADSLQDYHEYLPEPEDESRCIARRHLRKCPKYNRLLINFNYPGSSRPKQVLILPYLGDNAI